MGGGTPLDRVVDAIVDKHTLDIADKILELSCADTIHFPYVATIILQEFSELSDKEVATWVEDRRRHHFMNMREENKQYLYRLKEEEDAK